MAKRKTEAVPTLLHMMDRPEPKDGLAWGLFIHRHFDAKDWTGALERVPAEHRQQAEEYLRGIAARMRAQLAMARAAGFASVAEWKARER